MTITSAKDIVRGRINDLLADFSAKKLDQTAATVIYDNDPTDEPDPNTDNAWVRWWITFGAGRLAEIGRGRLNTHRLMGQAVAQVHTPVGRGTHKGNQVRDLIVSEFRSITVSDVVFHTPKPQAPFRNGPWWIQNVFVPFHTDQSIAPESLSPTDTPLSEPPQMSGGVTLVEDTWA